MAHIIGFTGAHGTGKSTILKALGARNLPNVVIDVFSVPRSVQADYGKPLAEIVALQENVPEYQERISRRKAEHLAALRDQYDDDVLVFTDRTPIDFYAYARTWVEQNNYGHEWLIHYRNQCAREMLGYNKVYLVPPRKFPFVAEVNRGSEDTQKKNHEFCKDFIRTFARPFKMVTPLNVEQRVDFCLKHARGFR